MEEEELVKNFEAGFEYSKEKIREVLKVLKGTEDTFDKDKLVAKILKVTEDTFDEDKLVSLEEYEDLDECLEMKWVCESVAREAVMKEMKSKGKFDERIVEALIEEKMSFNEKDYSIKIDIGCSEDLIRDVLTACHGDAEAVAHELRAKLVIREKSKNLAEALNSTHLKNNQRKSRRNQDWTKLLLLR